MRLLPKAFRDIDEIFAYIALGKLSPENAKAQTDRIYAALASLSLLPQAHQDRLVGRLVGKGYKHLLVDNYLAVFRINEEDKTVTVVTVQYQGRNK